MARPLGPFSSIFLLWRPAAILTTVDEVLPVPFLQQQRDGITSAHSARLHRADERLEGRPAVGQLRELVEAEREDDPRLPPSLVGARTVGYTATSPLRSSETC